jgi:septum site-determining protein MinC
MSDTLVAERKACFQFKTSFSPCTIMQVNHYDLTQLEQQLMATISRAPNFFIGSALIIDLEPINHLENIDFTSMKQIIIKNNMVPVGVRGGNEHQHAQATSAGIPVITVGRQTTDLKPAPKEEPPQEKQPVEEPRQEETPKEESTSEETIRSTSGYQQAKLITTPIRSGMQVYAKDADLIVVAPVSVGAELLADGNIHVYGPLRGRALAGVQGNTNARIFCRTLEAELVAIAGYYLVKEDMFNLPGPDATVQIYLQNEQVKIECVLMTSR